MINPPGASQIGARLTIALRDSQGNAQELLGVLQTERTILKRDGSLENFDPDSITHWRLVTEINAKAGFGAPLSMRIRELESAFTTTYPSDKTDECGMWLLRASADNALHRSSVLPTGARPFGEPGMEIDEAIHKVDGFYRKNSLPPTITVPIPAYTKLDEYLETSGWIVAAEINIMVIDTNDLPRSDKPETFTLKTSTEPTTEWLAVNGQQFTSEVLQYPANYLSIFIDDQIVASGRIAFTNNWGVITHVFVTHEYRRRGIGRLIMYALADTAREQGCSRLTLQVDSNNSPALSLCESLGFRLHHRDRCRVLPAS
jgi:GNAT superfamily N-acetyltransferase